MGCVTGKACPIEEIGRSLKVDKYDEGHRYGDAYCELTSRLKHSGQKVRLLEIGFGCGHHPNGASARCWHRFFESNLVPFYIDFPYAGENVDYASATKSFEECIANFQKEFPGVAPSVFLGDQKDPVFLNKVVTESGGLFDIIIDDGGHRFNLIMASLRNLWSHVVPGGYYVLEDLNSLSFEEVSVFTAWATAIAAGKGHPSGIFQNLDKSMPTDLLSISCMNFICVLKKKYAV